MAVNLAAELGVRGDDPGDIYYVALLAYTGCTADTQMIASVLGDEIAMGKYIAAIDYDRPAAMFGAPLRHVGEGHPPLRRAGILGAALAAGMRMGPASMRAHSAAHCEVAQLLADRLGFGPVVQQALEQVVERWDGTGALALAFHSSTWRCRLAQPHATSQSSRPAARARVETSSCASPPPWMCPSASETRC